MPVTATAPVERVPDAHVEQSTWLPLTEQTLLAALATLTVARS